jgi:hypothetical protein
MTTPEQDAYIASCITRNPTSSNSKLIKNMGSKRRLGIMAADVQRVRERCFNTAGVHPPSATEAPRKKKASALSRSAFANKFDTETKTRNAVRFGMLKLDASEDILSDSEFRTAVCEASTAGWRDITAEEEFNSHRFAVKGQIFWGSVDTKKWALTNVRGAIDQ